MYFVECEAEHNAPKTAILFQLKYCFGGSLREVLLQLAERGRAGSRKAQRLKINEPEYLIINRLGRGCLVSWSVNDTHVWRLRYCLYSLWRRLGCVIFAAGSSSTCISIFAGSTLPSSASRE
jgi:hypothetical protein